MIGFDPRVAADAQRHEVFWGNRIASARGVTWWAESLYVDPQRRQEPSLAATARDTRRHPGCWYGLAALRARHRLPAVS